MLHLIVSATEGASKSQFAELIIDDETWSSAPDPRRADWKLAITELVEDGVFELPADPPPPYRALVTLAPTALVLDVRGDGGKQAAHVELSLEVLRPYMTEYLAICRDLGRGGLGENSPKFEALDIAKRIAHDEAAELITSLARAIRPDHATARRIFTLAVTLCHDTTQLAALPHARKS